MFDFDCSRSCSCLLWGEAIADRLMCFRVSSNSEEQRKFAGPGDWRMFFRKVGDGELYIPSKEIVHLN